MKPLRQKPLITAIAAAIAALPLAIHAAPQDGKVVAGNATIRQESSTKIGITQTTDRAIIDWKSYSMGANEHVQYYQPSTASVSLNRVTGQDPSQILGRLTANGQVFLVNPNGIYFGKNAQIDVAGLVATTHNIRNEDFMAGRHKFDMSGKPGASVINEGMIRVADTGMAAFVAPSVANRGIVAAKLGRVVMAAANGFTLDFTGDNLLSFMVGDEVAQTAFDLEGNRLTSFVENSGKIEAQGGYVLLTARAAENAVHGVINHGGVIEAQTVEQKSGEIILHAGKGNLEVSGTLDASAPNGGDGGFIETSGGKVSVGGTSKITTVSPFGKTGTWLIDPTNFYIGGMFSDESGISGAALSSRLISNNVAIHSSQGTREGAGNIYVFDPITWSGATTLELRADNYVVISDSISGSSPGSGLRTVGKLLISDGGNVNVGDVRYDVLDSISLFGRTTAGRIHINSSAIIVESSESGNNAASLTPAEFMTLDATRAGKTGVGNENYIFLDAPEGITVNTALNSNHIKADGLVLFSWVGGFNSRVLINAPINLTGNYRGETGEFRAQARNLVLTSSGSVTADYIEYFANNMGLAGTTTPIAGGEFVKGGYIGYDGPVTRIYGLTTNQQQLIDQHRSSSVAELMVAVGNQLFVNDPDDHVWSGLYVNGSATTKQIAANQLQPVYDRYKNASASSLYSGILAGEIPEDGYVYEALVLKGGATAVDLKVAYAKYKQHQQGNCVTTGTCIKPPVDDGKKDGDEKTKEPPKNGEQSPPHQDLVDLTQKASTIIGTVNDLSAIFGRFSAASIAKPAPWLELIATLPPDSPAKSNVASFLVALDEINSINPKLADEVLDVVAKNDVSHINTLLSNYDKNVATKIVNITEHVGVALSALSVGMEAGELVAEIASGSASAEDYFKAATNISIAGAPPLLGLAGVTIGVTGTAAIAGYGAISLGKVIAEIREGESFSDAQQRYLDVVDNLSAQTSNFIKNEATRIAKGKEFDLSGTASKVRRELLDKIEQLNHIEAELTSAEARLAFGISFENTKRLEILDAVRKARSNFETEFSVSETVALNIYSLGHRQREITARAKFFEGVIEH